MSSISRPDTLRCPLILALLFAALAPAARAQPAAETQEAPASTSAPAFAADAPCIPGCRAGFFCQKGTCISLCNPPCPPGQICTTSSQCVAESAMVPLAVFNRTEPPLAPQKAAREKRDGFMLRFGLGAGGAHTKGPVSDTESLDSVNVSDFCWTASFDIGGSPMENLIVHGRLATVMMIEPAASEDGEKITTNDLRFFRAGLIGPAITYYVMPINLYLTGAIGLSRLTIRYERQDAYDSAQGIGFNLDLGKEWWFGDNWAIGVAGRFWYTRIPAKDRSDPDFISGAVLFSATYQ